MEAVDYLKGQTKAANYKSTLSSIGPVHDNRSRQRAAVASSPDHQGAHGFPSTLLARAQAHHEPVLSVRHSSWKHSLSKEENYTCTPKLLQLDQDTQVCNSYLVLYNNKLDTHMLQLTIAELLQC